MRDGRSFTTRRVVARQRGEAIFVMTASFHEREPGFDHSAPMPDAPAAGGLPRSATGAASVSTARRASA